MKQDDFRNALVALAPAAEVLALQVLQQRDDAADVVQDVLLKALAKPKLYDAKRGALRPWLLRMVRNRCFDHLRRNQRTDSLAHEPVDADSNPHTAAEQRDTQRAVQHALASLSSDHREVLVLRDHLELSYQEIAATMNIKEGTVMSRLHRARAAFRRALGGNKDEHI